VTHAPEDSDEDRDLDELAADYEALRATAGAARVPRDVVVASGPDTIGFLQGQLSQDVAALGVGDSAWTFLLEPQGKVVAWLRASRRGDDEVVLDVDGGFGDAVVARLERFKLRTRCDLTRVEQECVIVRGPDSSDVVVDGVTALRSDWPGSLGFDLLGDHVALPIGVKECGIEAFEAVRIESGVPAMGAELTERTIPAEAGPWIVSQSVSFTKGCFTGQELVARIDSRGGNVPRLLRGVVVDGSALPASGASLRVGDRDVGSLTSVARSPRLGSAIALAYVHRSVDVPAEVTVVWPGGEASARVESLPLVGER
jgi:folate-binding protein YgfZ